MRTIRRLLCGLFCAAIWPGYLLLAAYAARQAPWPRSTAVALEMILAFLALSAFVINLVRWVCKPEGWAEAALGVPPGVTRQVRRASLALVAAFLTFLLPSWLLARGLIAPGGRPISAPGLVRVLVLGFEVLVLCLTVRLVRRKSALLAWAAQAPERLGWLTRRRRPVALAVLVGIAIVIILDARGFSFSAHRLASGAAGSLAVVAFCLLLQRAIDRVIDRHAWRWGRLSQALRGLGPVDESGKPDDLAGRLRRLSGYAIAGLGLFLAAQVWEIDLALFRFISERSLWSVDGKDQFVTVGDLTRALVVVGLCGVAWRNLGTFFAVVVFPRMTDDPGIRFAVVTLCRYALLGLGALSGLSAIHLGIEKIGVVLAALGVGLGFGLQEIVSNFVCGIILLVERPIRVGDIVTVSDMTGKVDRINIRATTIINGDNQSMIVPNRAFITGDLVNWTLKDKIIRVTLHVNVAPGTDPDRVSELLVAIAREDADVLRNPVPSALMEEFGDSALSFALHVHVPEPSMAGRVRHRIFSQIQRRFKESGIEIPLPAQELLLKQAGPTPGPLVFVTSELQRVDGPSRTPPGPRLTAPVFTPGPLESKVPGASE
jgi:potassium efflux system protein